MVFEVFEGCLVSFGVKVVCVGVDYVVLMEVVVFVVMDNDWMFLFDSFWDGYIDLFYMLMEGYL